MGLEMEELLNMTEAHLANVKQEVAKLSQQKVAIDQEIEKLTAYLERGQAVLDSHRAEAPQKASPVKDTPFSSIAGGP